MSGRPPQDPDMYNPTDDANIDPIETDQAFMRSFFLTWVHQPVYLGVIMMFFDWKSWSDMMALDWNADADRNYLYKMLFEIVVPVFVSISDTLNVLS